MSAFVRILAASEQFKYELSQVIVAGDGALTITLARPGKQHDDDGTGWSSGVEEAMKRADAAFKDHVS